MLLSLIGMSGSGKSFWSMKLEEAGFRRFCCDDLIAARLSRELGEKFRTISDVGRWMGFPFEPLYREREEHYLRCEVSIMTRLLEELSECRECGLENMVVDTTGSVIYTGEAILGRLRELTTVVHLATPPEILKLMLETYTRAPRPVLWRDVFSKNPGETNEAALARCYPLLLAGREERYRQTAHLTVAYGVHHGRETGIGELLASVMETP